MGDAFVTLLLKWFDVHGRDLPWRHTADPYAIWLSEVILQQTRIAQGTDYWWRFMRRWPTVADLASATEDEVLRMWQGLGYYSRARHLHAAARQIVDMGGFPTSYADIRRLQGVGDYTAAAIASFAYGQPRAVVDGNVYRVLSRYEGIDTPINSTSGQRLFAALAQRHMDSMGQEGELCGRYNQAIMDFGALQCTPKSAPCLVCPLAEACVACRTGRVRELPVKLKTTRVKPRFFAYIYKVERTSGHPSARAWRHLARVVGALVRGVSHARGAGGPPRHGPAAPPPCEACAHPPRHHGRFLS